MPRLQSLVSLAVTLLGAAGSIACGLVEPEPPARDASVTPDARPATCAACLVAACPNVSAQCDQSSVCYDEYQCAVGAETDLGNCLCDQHGDIPNPGFVLLRCVHSAACGTGACASACDDPAVGPDAGIHRFTACELASADSLCDDGSGSGSSQRAGSTAVCDACVASHCAAFSAACGVGSVCQGYLTCLAGCIGASCVSGCADGDEEGLAAADALDVCLGGACEDACGF